MEVGGPQDNVHKMSTCPTFHTLYPPAHKALALPYSWIKISTRTYMYATLSDWSCNSWLAGGGAVQTS